MAYRYKIAGLVVETNVAFPRAAQLPRPADAPADVSIRLRDDIEAPEGLVAHEAWIAGAPGEFQFQPKPGLIFRVSAGTKIEIRRSAAIPDRDLNLFLIGSAWGVLCHQRGLLPLHCSAVESNGLAVAFTGPSGIGKSTLAASLCVRGFRHVCDDVGVIDTSADRGARMYAMPKGIKLWRDATDVLGVTRGDPVIADPRIDKYFVDPPVASSFASLGIGAIYVAEFADDGARPEIIEVQGSDALQSIFNNVYRIEWLRYIRAPQAIFAQSGKLAEQIPVFRFSRPRVMDGLGDSIDLIAEHMRSLTSRSEIA